RDAKIGYSEPNVEETAENSLRRAKILIRVHMYISLINVVFGIFLTASENVIFVLEKVDILYVSVSHLLKDFAHGHLLLYIQIILPSTKGVSLNMIYNSNPQILFLHRLEEVICVLTEIGALYVCMLALPI
ncbi:hypothetical protein ACJX0J_018936, partial [Zea mays]